MQSPITDRSTPSGRDRRKRLEIIHLRSSGASLETLVEGMNESISSCDKSKEGITIYCRAGLETDVAIHLHKTEASNMKGQSTLGLRFASELKAFGLVEHTIWEESR